MPSDIVLFWLVAAGFLIADNLVLLPAGCDYLRLQATGRFAYDASARLEARGRELVMLNPLNLFHRAAVTTCALGPVDRRSFLAERQRVARALPTLNLLSWLGYAYLAGTAALVSLSFTLYFGTVLALFLGLHLVFWAVMSAVLVARRQRLALGGAPAATLVIEALFVPAYTLNLGKRVWARRRVDLPALSLGIRQARRMRQEADRELMVHQLLQRLALIEASLPDAEAATQPAPAARPGSAPNPPLQPARLGDLVREAKTCLTA